MKRLLAAAALTALALTGAASGGHARAAGTVSSTRRVIDGHIRITATIATPAQVGRPLRVTYRVTNTSKATRKIRLGFALWYVVNSPDGTTYDTRTLLRGLYLPYVPPTKLRPGQTVTDGGALVRVRWAGPLRITPGWANAALPPVSVNVKPSTAPSRHNAIADVLAATGHLLDHCAPTRSGVAVIGRIDAPEHKAPPLQTRCAITLHREPGFFRAQVLLVSPPSLRGVHVASSPYERVSYPLKAGQNATAVGWLFVVTRSGTTSVDSTSVVSTKNHRGGAPGWQWTTAGVMPQAGGTKCGGTGGGGGGVIGPYVEFVSKCR
jgi:hypothetical protein